MSTANHNKESKEANKVNWLKVSIKKKTRKTCTCVYTCNVCVLRPTNPNTQCFMFQSQSKRLHVHLIAFYPPLEMEMYWCICMCCWWTLIKPCGFWRYNWPILPSFPQWHLLLVKRTRNKKIRNKKNKSNTL